MYFDKMYYPLKYYLPLKKGITLFKLDFKIRN